MNDECKYIAADWVCFENTPDLEIYKLCEDINVEIDLINETESQEKISPYKQEIVPFGFGEKEISGYLPPGKYWIGDLSYVMEDYFDKYLYMVEGVYQTQKNINFARFNTNGDGYYFDYEANSYGVDAGNIGCVEVEGIYEDNDLGKFHIFDFPFKCSKNEVEGYLRFGDVFIKTEKYSDFFLPPHLNTYKGKASYNLEKISR